VPDSERQPASRVARGPVIPVITIVKSSLWLQLERIPPQKVDRVARFSWVEIAIARCQWPIAPPLNPRVGKDLINDRIPRHCDGGRKPWSDTAARSKPRIYL